MRGRQSAGRTRDAHPRAEGVEIGGRVAVEAERHRRVEGTWSHEDRRRASGRVRRNRALARTTRALDIVRVERDESRTL